MIKEEFQKLLMKEWNEEEKQMIVRIMDGILYYKKLLPKSLKEDVICALNLCNTLKTKLENYENEIKMINEKFDECNECDECDECKNCENCDKCKKCDK